MSVYECSLVYRYTYMLVCAHIRMMCLLPSCSTFAYLAGIATQLALAVLLLLSAGTTGK